IQGNLYVELAARLRNTRCRPYTADLRVRVDATRLYTYPDISVVCGERLFASSKRNTLLNPVVVFEVLSDSTESYDRGKKFQHYRQIETLTDYILVAQDQIRVEQYTRQADGVWTLRDYANTSDQLKLDSINVSIPLADVYRDVEFPPTTE